MKHNQDDGAAAPRTDSEHLVETVHLSTEDPQHDVTLNVSDPAELIGSLVGNFRVKRLLGTGGFGVVYEALDELLERRAALKFIRNTADRKSRAHLIEEARLLANLSHPNIVQIYAVGEYNESVYIALEFIQRDVREYAATFPQGLPVREAIRIIAECTEALSFAHSRGVLHRDVKPANILIEQISLRAKLSDFGIAASHRRGENQGTLSGTPAYMSPEQSQGLELDPRTDIFSTGVTMYRLLAGKHPYDAPSVSELIPMLVVGEFTPLEHYRPDLPEAIRALVHKAMATSRKDRFQSVGEFSKRLRDALSSLRDSDEAGR